MGAVRAGGAECGCPSQRTGQRGSENFIGFSQLSPHGQTCQSTSQLVFLWGTSSLGPPFLFHLEPVVQDSLCFSVKWNVSSYQATGCLCLHHIQGTTSFHCLRKFPGAELSQLHRWQRVWEQSSGGKFTLPWSFMGMTSLTSISCGCQGVCCYSDYIYLLLFGSLRVFYLLLG